MLGIGTDIIEIERVKGVWDRQGYRFAERILTPVELSRMERKTYPWRYLAKRFAAKEAISKAFGCGIGAELGWHDLEVDASSKGSPLVVLSPSAQSLALARGGHRVLLSLSDVRAYAVAFAVLVP